MATASTKNSSGGGANTGIPQERASLRAMYALPLLAFVYLAQTTFNQALDAIPKFPDRKASSVVHLTPDLEAPLRLNYSGWEPLDAFLSLYAAVFTASIGGYDAASRMQMVAFLADLVPVQVIFFVEGARRGNAFTAAHLLPTLISIMYQVKGIAFLGPIYYFLHYLQSPIGKYALPENRQTQIRAVSTIIPTILLTYIVPGIAMFTVPGITNRQFINGLIWQPFPIYAAILQFLFSLVLKNTLATTPRDDMAYLHRAYAFAAATAAVANLFVRLVSPVSPYEVFLSNLMHPNATVTVMEGCAKALRYDQLCSFGAGTLWILLSFWDLKKAGKLEAGWVKIVAAVVGATLLFGPGAMMAAMWAWREEVLAEKTGSKGKAS